ncbi:MAG: hypothetical protein ACI4IT_02575 [Oscillospiraceae bacterium]
MSCFRLAAAIFKQSGGAQTVNTAEFFRSDCKNRAFKLHFIIVLIFTISAEAIAKPGILFSRTLKDISITTLKKPAKLWKFFKATNSIFPLARRFVSEAARLFLYCKIYVKLYTFTAYSIHFSIRICYNRKIGKPKIFINNQIGRIL